MQHCACLFRSLGVMFLTNPNPNPLMNPKKHALLLAFSAVLSLPVVAEEPAKKEDAPKTDAAKPAETAPTLDFGDHGSATLTTKAWQALAANNHAAVDGYTAKCVEL